MAERVLLVNAPNPSNGDTAGNYAVFPSMGIVNIGTNVQKHYPEIDVKVLDGGVLTAEEIKQHMDTFNPDIVGLSVLTPTYGEGLKLAEYAKNGGATTVLGNDHASFFPELVVQRKSVDYVAKAEFGEAPFLQVIRRERGEEQSDVVPGTEGVYFLEGGEVKVIPVARPLMRQAFKDDADIPNLSLLSETQAKYKERYNQTYGKFHESERNPTVINNVRGCGNGEQRCTYCSIYDLDLNSGSPEFFWRTVQKQNEEYSINFFFEVCDSFLTFQKYARELIATKPFDPKEVDIEFEIYARANDVVNTPASIEWLRELNVTRVNLGLDSGDDNMLKLLRKNNRDRRNALSPSEINYRAVERLADAGITVHASFPLGGLGETPDSLEKTVMFIDRMASDFGRSLATLEASELIPLPNSPAWDLLLMTENPVFGFSGGLEGTLDAAGVYISPDVTDELRRQFAGKDLLDITELATAWIDHYTHVTWDDIESCKRIVSETATRTGSQYGRAI